MSFALVGAILGQAPTCKPYCLPGDACFPGEATWASELGAKLGDASNLFKVPTGPELKETYQKLCVENVPAIEASRKMYNTDPNFMGYLETLPWVTPPYPYKTGWSAGWSVDMFWFNLSFIERTYPWAKHYGFHGICLQNPDAEYVDGDPAKELNLPAYTVAARSIEDVQAALAFATKYGIQVTVKNTGHDYHSGSTAKGSLSIWTAMLPKYGQVDTEWADSCGTTIQEMAGPFGVDGEVPQAALKFGAGQPFREVYQYVLDAGYYMVGGVIPGVGVGGGWLMGGGLSMSTRHLGYGIDNAVQFEVVLPTGEFITADACTNTDIYWALRGGGGGSFGVLTSIVYKLWGETEVHDVNIAQLGHLCLMIPNMQKLTVDWMLKVSDNHEFGECGDLPSGESAWNDAIRSTDGFPSCIQRKMAHLCGSWVNFLLDFYASSDGRWGNHADPQIVFRGPLADARATFLDQMDAFWSFSGADALDEAYAAEDTVPYVVRSWPSFAQYRYTLGMTGPFALMAKHTYEFSGVCPGATSPGECVKDWVEDVTGEPYIGPTDGYLWAHGMGYRTMMGGYNSKDVATCSRIINILDPAERAKVTSEPHLSNLLLGMEPYFLGGAASKVPANATAIGPAMRSGQLYLTIGGNDACNLLTGLFPDGIGFNHHGHYKYPTQAEFEEKAWGSNVPRLKSIKAAVDPKMIMNAKDTFGYLPACPGPYPVSPLMPPSPPMPPPPLIPPPCVPCNRIRKTLFASASPLPCCP